MQSQSERPLGILISGPGGLGSITQLYLRSLASMSFITFVTWEMKSPHLEQAVLLCIPKFLGFILVLMICLYTENIWLDGEGMWVAPVLGDQENLAQ